jgi:hypothetical protein
MWEIHALAARGWTVSAISRHTGRGRRVARASRHRLPQEQKSSAGWCVLLRIQFRPLVQLALIAGSSDGMCIDDLTLGRARSLCGPVCCDPWCR